MSNPTKYVVSNDFSTLPPADHGAAMQTELEAIAQSSVELVKAIGDVRRSDGALRNRIVGQDDIEAGLVDQLAAETSVLAQQASAAEAVAVGAVPQAVAASEAAAAASQRIADRAANIARYGYPDYGFITEPPGPPREEQDYGTL